MKPFILYGRYPIFEHNYQLVQNLCTSTSRSCQRSNITSPTIYINFTSVKCFKISIEKACVSLFNWYFSLTSSLQSMPNCLILFEFKSNSIFCFGNQFKYNSVHLISETNGCFNIQKHFFSTEEFFVILWFVWINVKNK